MNENYKYLFNYLKKENIIIEFFKLTTKYELSKIRFSTCTGTSTYRYGS